MRKGAQEGHIAPRKDRKNNRGIGRSVETRANLNRKVRQWIRDHFGIISRWEALRLGASSEYIRGKLASGDWVVMFRGVYRDAAALYTPMQDVRAAYVATRGVGVVSHRSAGWMWGMVEQVPATVEISIPRHESRGRRLEGVTVHRSTDLDAVRGAVNRNGMLVTNPLRTIVDLASVLPPGLLTDAVDVALAKRQVTVEGLTAEIDRLSQHGRRGVGPLRRHLDDRGFVGAPSASVLESRTRRMVNATNLPVPRVEHRAGENGEYRLDLAWDEIRFGVEVDGYLWHFNPEHQQRDLRRRAALQDQGWTLRIYTWRDISDEPARVAREIVMTYDKLTRQQDRHTEP